MTKYDKGIYLLVVASRMAASRPLQRNLSNDSFLRVLFWNNAVRLRAADGDGDADDDADDISLLYWSGQVHYSLMYRVKVFQFFTWLYEFDCILYFISSAWVVIWIYLNLVSCALAL